jgi:probable phosphoglycerate mutase
LPPTELLLLRHAQSTWNARGMWQGQGDPPLSDAGRSGAAACVPRVRELAPELAITSDLGRALETARIIARALGLELQVDPRWREWDVGLWSGCTHDEVRRRWPELYRAFRAGDPELAPPGGERRSALEKRVRAATRELIASHPGRRVLVVTHRGVIRTLLPEKLPEHLEINSLRVHSAGDRERSAQGPADPE